MNKGRTYRRNLYSRNEVMWHLTVALLTLYAVYRVPVDIVLGTDHTHGLGLFDIVLVLAFVIDPVVTIFFARKHTQGRVKSYVKVLLLPDVLAALSIIAFSRGNGYALLALLKVIHVTYFINTWRWQLIKRSNLIRLLLFVYWLVILVHITACGWIVMREQIPVVNPNSSYIEALYWSVTTLTTIGYGDIVPHNHPQMLYAIFIMLIGFVMMGYLIGNISGLLNRSDPLRAQYAAALEEVTAFVQYHNLPSTLTHRIVEYFGYMWRQRAAFDEPHILNSLPSGLRSEVSLHLKRDVIQRVPFFREAGEQFIREIANQMRPLVATPGELVFHFGDPANHMYFISQGTLDVLDQNMVVIGTLTDGDFFGEMALLEHRRRGANVRARDYCNLYVLDSESFNGIIEQHSDFKSYMERIAHERAAFGSEKS